MRITDNRTPKGFFDNEKNWINAGDENKKLLQDFEQEKAAQGASEGTRYMYLFCVVKLARHFNGKGFRELGKREIIEFFEKWKDYKSKRLKGRKCPFF